MTQQAVIGEIVSIVVIGVSVAGLVRTAQMVGALLYTLECAGAIGGKRQGA